MVYVKKENRAVGVKKRLAQAIKKTRLSDKAISERTGLTVTTIWRARNMIGGLGVDTLIMLVHGLGCSEDDFVWIVRGL